MMVFRGWVAGMLLLLAACGEGDNGEIVPQPLQSVILPFPNDIFTRVDSGAKSAATTAVRSQAAAFFGAYFKKGKAVIIDPYTK